MMVSLGGGGEGGRGLANSRKLPEDDSSCNDEDDQEKEPTYNPSNDRSNRYLFVITVRLFCGKWWRKG